MRFQGRGWGPAPDEAEAGPSKILSTAKVGSGRATLPLLFFYRESVQVGGLSRGGHARGPAESWPLLGRKRVLNRKDHLQEHADDQVLITHEFRIQRGQARVGVGSHAPPAGEKGEQTTKKTAAGGRAPRRSRENARADASGNTHSRSSVAAASGVELFSRSARMARYSSTSAAASAAAARMRTLRSARKRGAGLRSRTKPGAREGGRRVARAAPARTVSCRRHDARGLVLGLLQDRQLRRPAASSHVAASRERERVEERKFCHTAPKKTGFASRTQHTSG